MRRRLLIVAGIAAASLGLAAVFVLVTGTPMLTASGRLPDRLYFADRTYEHHGDDACEVPTASVDHRFVHVQDVFVVFGHDLPVFREASDPSPELPTSLVVERRPGCEVWYSLLGGP